MKIPLSVPKPFLHHKFGFIFASILYCFVPFFVYYFVQEMFIYLGFFVAWYGMFLIFVLLIAYIQKIAEDRRRIRAPIKFVRQKHFTHRTNPKLALIKGAEVGVNKGKHALQIVNYLNLEKLYLIDPWQRYIDHNVEGFPEEDPDEVFKIVEKKFKDYKCVEIIRDISINASKQIGDSTLDFVYIDANHEHVLEDLHAWYPKLKSDGVLCGDDFGHPSSVGLIRAVTEFAYEKKLLVFSVDNQYWMVKP